MRQHLPTKALWAINEHNSGQADAFRPLLPTPIATRWRCAQAWQLKMLIGPVLVPSCHLPIYKALTQTDEECLSIEVHIFGVPR